MSEGLTPQSRMFVHISDNIETAKEVGKRHGGGTLVVLEINTEKMTNTFYVSAHGVWLTDHVSPEYIRPMPSF
jgi:putative RNA 2'-phosphotransferase